MSETSGISFDLEIEELDLIQEALNAFQTITPEQEALLLNLLDTVEQIIKHQCR